MTVLRPLLLSAFCLLLAGSAGCSANRSPDVYSTSESQTPLEVSYATVSSVRKVTIQEDARGTGAVSGAALGASLGYIPGGGMIQPALMIGGGILGMTVGPSVERALKRQKAMEIEVILDDNTYAVFVQGLSSSINVGDRVRVIRSQGGQVRIQKL